MNRYIIIALALIMCGLQSCFPSFEPQKELIKKIETKDCSIEWYNQIGILDQRFPQIIVVKNNNSEEVTMSVHDLYNLDIVDETILLYTSDDTEWIIEAPKEWKEYSFREILVNNQPVNNLK